MRRVAEGGHGDMYWYRWDVNANAWISNTGRWMGYGRIDWATTATPNACTLISTMLPARPVVPAWPNGPAVLRYTTNGNVHCTYVGSEERVVHASGIDVGGGSSFGYTPWLEITNYAEQTSTDPTALVMPMRTPGSWRTSTTSTPRNCSATRLRPSRGPPGPVSLTYPSFRQPDVTVRLRAR